MRGVCKTRRTVGDSNGKSAENRDLASIFHYLFIETFDDFDVYFYRRREDGYGRLLPELLICGFVYFAVFGYGVCAE